MGELGGREVLQQVADGAGAQRARHVRPVVEGGQHDDPAARHPERRRLRRDGPRRGPLHRYHRIEGGTHTDGLVALDPAGTRPMQQDFVAAFDELVAWTR
ncbi:hypothetical protein GCM10023235_62630 [Kitasatospora terrestris]|uniref:Uncharacterized protein n=1 Tax=Kitasatospora terrestris TaxID=258051 RepID=A0ABP9EBU3_9ACTN